MNKLLYTICLFIFSIQSFGQFYNIQEAIDGKIIEYKITGTWNSLDKQEFIDADGQYYGKCMKITFRSKSLDTIYIFIDYGQILVCEDTLTQNMIITKPLLINLIPKQTKTLQLYAMCLEISDYMPDQQKIYKFGEIADSNLIEITRIIDDMFMQNIIGQGAIWAYTDKATREDLIKYGATEASLEMTIEILKKSKVITKLTTHSKPESSKKDTTVLIKGKNKPLSPNENYISINLYYIYAGCGVILFLLLSTIYLIRRNRKNEKNKIK